MPYTFRKPERLNRKKVLERMFAGGARSYSFFPLRVVYVPAQELEAPVSVLVSVSKRRFKRAVKRNRVKRQVREAYRLNKHLLLDVLPPGCPPLAVAFIYLADELCDSALITRRMQAALARVADNLAACPLQATTPFFCRHRLMKRFFQLVRRFLSGLLLIPIYFYQRCLSPPAGAVVPLHAHLLAICRGGHQEARPAEGAVPCRAPHPAVPPLGRVGLRPCAVRRALFKRFIAV